MSKRKATSTPKQKVSFKKQKVPMKSMSSKSLLEKKFFDTSAPISSDISAGTVFNSTNLIPQGTTDQTRIGNKITIKNFNIRMSVTMDDQSTGTMASSLFRYIVFVDKQANGATASVTDILKSANIFSYRNSDQVDRFDILIDKTIEMPLVSANALHTCNSTKYITFGKKVNVPVHFSSTTGAITELRSNNIGLLYISDTAIVNVANSLIRVKFVDA